MALAFDANPPSAHSGSVVNPAKLRDEIHRISQRLTRARESYNQDFLSGDPEVPLDQQLAVIESYSARLEVATEQLRQHDAGEFPTAEVPEQPSPPQLPTRPRVDRNLLPQPELLQSQPQLPQPQLPQPQLPQPEILAPQVAEVRAPLPEVPGAQSLPPQVPAPRRASLPGPGIANPDGSPLLGDGGTVLRTEDAAVGEYIRHAADQRWLTATGRAVGEFDAICDGILAALAHKHGVPLEDERKQLARQVDARYRRDYG